MKHLKTFYIFALTSISLGGGRPVRLLLHAFMPFATSISRCFERVYIQLVSVVLEGFRVDRITLLKAACNGLEVNCCLSVMFTWDF